MFKRLMTFLVCVVLMSGIGASYAESWADEMDEMEAYVASIFPFESMSYYPYHPTHIDPINYTGYVAWDGGLLGDWNYTYYTGWTEETNKLQDYLDFLAYWGYVVEQQPFDEPGITAWRAVSTEQRTDRRPLLPTVYVYHSASIGMLMIAYSELDALIYDQWLDAPSWRAWNVYDPVILPVDVQLSEDVTVTVEGFLCKKELFILADGELEYAPYSEAVLAGHGIYRETIDVGDQRLHHLYCDMAGWSDQELMCVKVSFDAAQSQQIVPYLRAGLVADLSADGNGDGMYVSIVQLAENPQSKGVYAVPDPNDCNALWLIFPYFQREENEVERLYLCLEDENDPWIGDLRDWQYVNFHIENRTLD